MLKFVFNQPSDVCPRWSDLESFKDVLYRQDYNFHLKTKQHRSFEIFDTTRIVLFLFHSYIGSVRPIRLKNARKMCLYTPGISDNLMGNNLFPVMASAAR